MKKLRKPSRNKKMAVVVIPGLGDERSVSIIRHIVEKWNNESTSVHVFDSRWSSDESVEDKHSRLLRFYERFSVTHNVSVVAFSAGGALATHLFAKSPTISKVILICSKIKGSDTIGPSFVARAPSIIPAVVASEKALQKLNKDGLGKLICYRPIFDGVVHKKDMSVPGAKKKLIPTTGHAISIGFALLFLVKKQLG